MKKTLFTRAGAIAAVAAVFLFGFAPTAEAAMPPATASSVVLSAPAAVHSVVPAVTEPSVCPSADGATQSPVLPVSRWAQSTADMHSRLDGGTFGINAEMVQRNALQNGGMATGNFMWSLGTGLAGFAINFCILESAGGAADQIGHTIGESMLSPGSGLLAGLVFIGVIGLLINGMRRGTMQWKPIMMKAVIVGVFVIMVIGAGKTTGGGFEGQAGAYHPGVGSPGWIVTTMNNTVSSLASAPAAALSLDTGKGTTMKGADPLNCSDYTLALKQEYMGVYSGPAKLSSGVPLILSSIWETTGLRAWRTAQFGNAKDDGMSGNVWCHFLDQKAAVAVVVPSDQNEYGSVRNILGDVFRASGTPLPDNSSPVWDSTAFVPSDNTRVDHSLVGWATCKLPAGADWSNKNNWDVDAFNKGDKEHKADQDTCRKFWNVPNDSLDNFEWSTSGDSVNTRTTTDDKSAGLAVRQFIRTMHGNDNQAGMTTILAYNLGALGMLIVFGLISIAIIVSKIALVVMIVIAFFMMLQALMPGADMGKLGGFLKTMMGMTLFIFSIQLIFAFVSVFTRLLQEVGTNMLGGDSSVVATVWSGMAPLVAVGILHMMFTKVMKIPSPFSVSGGLSWGNAMGSAAGGAAFAGVSSLLERGQSRMKGRASNAAKGSIDSGKRGLSTAVGRATGGRIGGVAGASSGRRNAAAPAGLEDAAKGVLAGAGIESARRKNKGKGGKEGMEESTTRGTEEAVAAGSGESTTGAETAAATSGASKPTVERMDHTLLSTSRVANSQLAKGKMGSREERAVVKGMAADELAAAKRHNKEQREAMGITTPDTFVGRRLASVKNNMANAHQELKDRPVQFLGKAAKKTAGAVVLGTALAATGGIALPVAALAIGYGAKKAYKATPAGQRAKNDSMVNDYRAGIEKTKPKGGGNGGSAKTKQKQSSGTGANTPAGGEGAPTQATPAERPNPSGPSTAQISVVPRVTREPVPAAAAPLKDAPARPDRASR
ncbi:MAG TPA: hypothetical protein VF867_10040 [Arthrobacter sp.]